MHENFSDSKSVPMKLKIIPASGSKYLEPAILCVSKENFENLRGSKSCEGIIFVEASGFLFKLEPNKELDADHVLIASPLLAMLQLSESGVLEIRRVDNNCSGDCFIEYMRIEIERVTNREGKSAMVSQGTLKSALIEQLELVPIFVEHSYFYTFENETYCLKVIEMDSHTAPGLITSKSMIEIKKGKSINFDVMSENNLEADLSNDELDVTEGKNNFKRSASMPSLLIMTLLYTVGANQNAEIPVPKKKPADKVEFFHSKGNKKKDKVPKIPKIPVRNSLPQKLMKLKNFR